MTQREQVANWLTEFGIEHIVIALDINFDDEQQPIAMTHGWQNNSKIILWDLLSHYEKHNLKHLLCTDISRDGTLQGPNLSLYQQCQRRFPNLNVQASGGIGQLADLKQLKKINVASVIIGQRII